MAITPISSWKKTVYIAKKITSTINNGEQTKVYNTPVAFTINVQPLSDDARIELFGANSKKMYKGIVLGTSNDINEFDVAYLEGALPTGEPKNGFNSNFVVRKVMVQNVVTAVFFESIKGR